MTASYGRPGSSKVSAFFAPQKADPLKPVQMPTIQVGQNGRIVDMSSPEQAGINAAKPFQELANFFKQAGEVGVTAAKLKVKDDVDRELGKIAAQPEMLDAYRKGDQEARDWISQFRPQTQNLVNKASANAAVVTYEQELLAKSAVNSVLKNPYASEEARSAEFAKIKADAQKASGFEFVPPVYLGEQAESMMIAEAGAKGQLSKQRAATEFTDQNQTLATGWASQMFKLAQNQQSDEAVANPEKFAATRNAWFKQSVEMIEQARTPQEAAAIMWGGFSQAYNVAIAGGEFADYQQAQQLLEAMKSLTNSDIKFANGQTLGNVALGEGKTIGSSLAELEFKLQPAMKAAQEEQSWKDSMDIYKLALQGNDGAANALAEKLLPELFSDPRQLVQARQLLEQTNNIARTPTNEQIQNEALIALDLEQPGQTWEQQKARILNGNLTWEQKLRLSGKVQNPSSQDQVVSRAATIASPELAKSAEVLAVAQQNAITAGRLDQGVAPQTAEQLMRDALIETQKRTRESIAQRATDGKPALSQDEVNALFRENLSNYQAEQLTRYNQKAEEPITPARRLTGTLNVIRQNLLKNGGKPNVGIFPPALRKEAEAAGYANNYDGVQRYFLKALGAATEKNDKGQPVPVWRRPAEAWREMTKGVSTQLNKPNADAALNTNQGLRGLDNRLKWWVEDNVPFMGGGDNEKNRNSELDRQEVGGWIGKTLNTLMGVSAANAKEFDPANMENLAVLAKLTRPNTPSPSLDTPPLPQAQAAAPATPVPVAIQTDRHPFFIAIGINEGTRTASGQYTKAYFGHTDPGNGRRNVGTVSGQQGGSPATSDRRWAGILSGTGQRVEPLLRRLGVEPGTVGFNRLMFNVLDLRVQAPAAVGDFIKALPQVIKGGLTVEAIAKARANAFFIPGTSQLDAPGFGNSYQRLFRDQRSRAGTFDYKRRL